MVLRYLQHCGRTKKAAYDAYATRLNDIIRSLDVSKTAQAAKSNTNGDDDDNND